MPLIASALHDPRALGVAVVAWVAWAVWAAPSGSARSAVAAGACGAILAAWGVGAWAVWWGVPVGLVEPVREGVEHVLEQAWAQGGGPLTTAWAGVVGTTHAPRIDLRVPTDLALGAATLAALVGWARWRSGSRAVALGLALALLGAPAARVGVLSGGGAAAVWPLQIAILAGIGAAWGGRSPAVRGTGVAWAVAATAEAAAVRPELGGIVLVSAGVGILHGAGAGRLWGAASRRERWVAAGSIVAIVAAIGVRLGPVQVEAVPGPTEMAAVAHALHPRSAALVWVPGAWVAVLPPLLAVAVVVGVFLAPVRVAGLGLAALVIARVHHAAAHGALLPVGPHGGSWDPPAAIEILRYTGTVVPLLAVVAVEALCRAPARLRPWLPVLACLPAVPAVLPIQPGSHAAWTAHGHVVTDQAFAVRALVAAQRATPGAWFVARTHPVSEGRQVIWRAPRSGDPVLETASTLPDDGAPVFGWDGLACAVAGAVCDDPGDVLWEAALPDVRHLHPDHGAPIPAGAVVRLRRVR